MAINSFYQKWDTGTVKWYNPLKGYGYIRSDRDGSDIFVHQSALGEVGSLTLNEGDWVEYQLLEMDNRRQALFVRPKST